MSQKDWDKLARKQFEGMPADFKNDWQDLRHKVHKA